MSFFVRGAMVEYGTDVFGPIPNIVVFQFNPEKISRRLKIPQKIGKNEPHQTSAPPNESLSITAYFSAADDLGKVGATAAVPRLFGIGPQLAALEKMVYPEGGMVCSTNSASLDATGKKASNTIKDDKATGPTPREQTPRILFIWGQARVLPVEISSLSITEQKFDARLNPVQAEVQIELDVACFSKVVDDKVGKGALKYTQMKKDQQAALNLAKVAELAIRVIPF